jgi:hypothetical protein
MHMGEFVLLGEETYATVRDGPRIRRDAGQYHFVPKPLMKFLYTKQTGLTKVHNFLIF